RTRLGEDEAPLALYREILAEDPRHAGARGALDAWARSTGPGSSEALAALDAVLQACGEHARRVELREGRLAVALPEDRIRLFHEIRDLQERALAQPLLAFNTCCRAVAELGPREDLLPHLERL